MHNDDEVNEIIDKDFQIVHRDLKPENVLLNFANKDKTGTPEIKLIDFGTAEHVKKGEPLMDRVGTISYMAPEVVNAGKFMTSSGMKENTYDCKCDIWSVGVIAYAALCGQPPIQLEDPDVPDFLR